MKQIALICFFCMTCGYLYAQQTEEPHVFLYDVVVKGQRLLSQIGVQKTEIDSASLRQNITSNLADVLSAGSTIFIKSYGRATLSTASFRGTAPSHTQVTWNGIKLNSPMLGQVDFSLIPSYLIDKVTLYHGASSTGVTGGGLGGAVSLQSGATGQDGLQLKYIQGISSYHTFDEFLQLGYGGKKWETSTRLLYSSSRNDFSYTNYRKKNYTYNGDGEIDGFYYPQEKNKNGSFKDFHVMQEIYYKPAVGHKISLYAWYLNSLRGVPMLNVDYKEENKSKNEQHEQTLRSGLGWEYRYGDLKLSANAGYTYTDLSYIYLADIGKDELSEMIHSQSNVHTGNGKIAGEYSMGDKWLFNADISLQQHQVNSIDRAIITQGGDEAIIGYKKSRTELSGFLSVRYTPVKRWGIAVNLREEYNGGRLSPFIPALFTDYLLTPSGTVRLKASIAKNHRFPTLNDLYFMPGGNDSLRTEKGFTYDGGVEFLFRKRNYHIGGEVTGYNSYIRDWIVWLPTFKGFWTPENVKKVHSYGLEIKANASLRIHEKWLLTGEGNYAITRSINQGDPKNWADGSIGRQLVYIPEYSSGFTGRVQWNKWVLTYKWNYYSERFTTSSNEKGTKTGILKPYYMNDVALEKEWPASWGICSLKLAVNNIFNEEYESVLSRPMAGRNYGVFIGITPFFRNK